MKNTQKKKITRNYHLLTKVESGKCGRVTAAIDVICHVMSQERGKTSLQCPSGGQRLGIVVICNAR